MLTQPLTKDQVIKAIQAMPQQEFFSIEEVVEEILLLVKTNEGVAAMANGETQSDENVK